MSDRVLDIDHGVSMGAAIAKEFERERIAGERRIEIRTKELLGLGHDLDGMLHMNRKERRSYGSSKKHLKGLRP